MTGTPVTVGPKTDIRILKAMFDTYEFNAFPVVDGRHVLLGVVTRFDFLKRSVPREGAAGSPTCARSGLSASRTS